MADTGTGMIALGVALGGKDILIKMLGPTAEYLGNGMKDFATQRIENVKNIFSNASAKMGSNLDEEGSVPPKVLKGILDDGSFANDVLSVEYFGGVLASSKTPSGRDDRGAYFNALISRLSVYQLRCHYIFYHLFKRVFNGETTSFNSQHGSDLFKIFVPFDTYTAAMAFDENKETSVLWQYANILAHVMNGLAREGLIGSYYAYGGQKEMVPIFSGADWDGGIIVTPTSQGAELFLWAYGKGKAPVHEFFKNKEEFKLDESIKIPKPAVRVTMK